MTEYDYSGKKVAFFTLGCKLNFSETSALGKKFEALGFEIVNYKDIADVYVVNSCSVTADSDKKSRNMIRSGIRRNPNALVMVTGCYAQLKSSEIEAINGVDYIIGQSEKMLLTSYLNNLEKNEMPVIRIIDHNNIKTFHSAYSYGDRTRSFLKVQDGCNYFCTYCTIPMARGRSRNDSIENTVARAREVAQKGMREIILTGVNIGDFGRSTNETFIDLIKELDNVDGIDRYRISSIEPNLITSETIEFVAYSKRFMPHFHIPLQAGSNEVLKLMKRRYHREVFAEKVDVIRREIPDAFIGVDIIAGTNGEIQGYFEDSYAFIADLDVSQLHAFPYSERPGTKALGIKPVIPVPERKDRVKKYIHLSERKLMDFYSRFLNTVRPVLFESMKDDNHIVGWTDNYIRVKILGEESLKNKIVPILLQEIDSDGIVLGKLANQ